MVGKLYPWKIDSWQNTQLMLATHAETTMATAKRPSHHKHLCILLGEAATTTVLSEWNIFECILNLVRCHPLMSTCQPKEVMALPSAPIRSQTHSSRAFIRAREGIHCIVPCLVTAFANVLFRITPAASVRAAKQSETERRSHLQSASLILLHS